MASSPDPQSIANVLGGVVRGGSVHVPTPGHSSRDRGTVLTVDANAPDGLLVHSFNGGDPLAIKDQLRAAGVLEDRQAGSRSLPPPRWRETGVYEYDDGGGKVIYRTRRLEADGRKRFVAERFEAGRWVNGLGDVDRLPYRFTALCEAAQAARDANEPQPLVYFVEGERKADKLASWGLLATAIAFGANGWREEYGEAFTGGPVIILPDNDEPGMRFAETVKAGIEDYGGTAIILELPGLPHKGDIMDWEGTRQDLESLAAKALAGEALPMASLDLAALAGCAPRSKAFAVQHLAPLGEVTLLTGAGSAGKSLFGQQLATCAASGLQCLGLDVMAGSAVYLTCEDDEAELHWRQSRICDALGVDMAGLAGNLHLISLRGALGNELGLFGHDGTLSPTPAFRRLVSMLKATGAKLAILDNVSHLFTGNENDRGEVTRFVNLLNRAASDAGAAIILVGHPNKSGDDYSGSTAWLNALRSQVTMTHDLDTDVRTLTVGKANYTRKGEAIRFVWFEGAFVLEGDLSPDVRAELAEVSRSNGEDAAFMACLRARTDQGRPVGPNSGPNYAPSQFEGMAEAKGFKRTALKRAMDRLYGTARIRTVEVARPGKSETKSIIVEIEL